MVLKIHPQNPQNNRIKQVANIIKDQGVIAYPTDSGYALGCALDNKNGLARIAGLRNLNKQHHFTLMLANLSHISDYALLSNRNFRLLKKVLPGAYTFILPATKLVPNRLLHKKRKTIGIRVSAHIFVKKLLAELKAPMMSVSLRTKNSTKVPYYNIDDVLAVVNKRVDCVIDMGYCPSEPTTVIDLINAPILIRQGKASSAFLN